MLFSILVPVYNTEQYLKECIESVLSQGEQDFELILVDDGSTDTSGTICEQYCAQYPNKVRVIHQANKGLILTRRVGIAAANGQYCMFLDADDAYEPECIATVRETIERTGADIVIFNNYSYFQEDGKIEPNKTVFEDNTEFVGDQKKSIYEILITSERLNNFVTKAIRTPLLTADDTPYETFADNPQGEDLLQTLYPVTHAQHIVYRTAMLYRYRRHASSVTRKLDADRAQNLFDGRVIALLRRYMSTWGMDTPEYQDKLDARLIKSRLTTFWQYFRAAQTKSQKQELLDDTWFSQNEELAGLNNRYVPRMRRLQMRAILKKQIWLLNGICRLGTMKMRSARGT